MTAEEALAVLQASPAHLASVVAGVDAALLRAAPSVGEWSANEVLAHLRACADVWGGCVATILSEDSPTIRAISPRSWIDSTDYGSQAFGVSLGAFVSQRTELVAVLSSLDQPAWSRGALVTGAGRPSTRTVLDYVDRMARHERPHLGQIERCVRATR